MFGNIIRSMPRDSLPQQITDREARSRRLNKNGLYGQSMDIMDRAWTKTDNHVEHTVYPLSMPCP